MAVPTPPKPDSGPRAFTNDPVLISWVVFTFIQAVVAVLLVAKVLNEVAGGVIVGIVAAAYAAVSQLFVRPATVPRQPLQQLAYDSAQQAGDVSPSTTPVVELTDLPVDPKPTTS